MNTLCKLCNKKVPTSEFRKHLLESHENEVKNKASVNLETLSDQSLLAMFSEMKILHD